MLPVVRRLGLKRECPCGWRVIGEERLKESRAHRRPIALPAHGPDVIKQHAIGPRTTLTQHHSRWPGPHLPNPSNRSVAVGSNNAGPTPQIQPPAVGAFGEKNRLCVMLKGMEVVKSVRLAPRAAQAALFLCPNAATPKETVQIRPFHSNLSWRTDPTKPCAGFA